MSVVAVFRWNGDPEAGHLSEARRGFIATCGVGAFT
jgi:hypothetical protein